MNAQTLASSSSKNCKRPINRSNHTVLDCLDTHVISDDSETEQNINTFKSKPQKYNMKPNTLKDIIQLTKSIEFGSKTENKDDYKLNKRIKIFKDLQPSQNYLEIIEVDSRSSETNEPEILIVPPPVPLDSILFKTSSGKTSDFATSTPSSIKKLKAGPLPSPPPSPPMRPMLKNTAGNFEKYLANLEKRFTKLSSEDKVLNWNFSNEVDDVEDFVDFENNGELLKMKFSNDTYNNNNNINNNNILNESQIKNSFLGNHRTSSDVSFNKSVIKFKSATNLSTKLTKKQKNQKNTGQKKVISNGRIRTEDVMTTISKTFKVPNVPRKYLLCKPCQNSDEGCGSSDCEFQTDDHKEEFCKYLGLSTRSQNGEILSPTADNSDIKRRSLRVRHLQGQARVAHQNQTVSKISEIIHNAEDQSNMRLYAVKPEKIINPHVYFQQNNSIRKNNGEIRIIRRQNAINLKTNQSRQNLINSLPINIMPETPNLKSKIKIVCSLNNNVQQRNDEVSNHNNAVAHTTLTTESRNSGSPLSMNSKTYSHKPGSLGHSSCHADDENSSQNINVSNLDKKVDSLIIVKNSYEQKPSCKLNPALLNKTNQTATKLSQNVQTDAEQQQFSNDYERDKGKIKIIERLNYSPKRTLNENGFSALNHPKIDEHQKNNFNSRVPQEEDCKDVKDKIKIEFTANYNNKYMNEDLENKNENENNYKMIEKDQIKNENSIHKEKTSNKSLNNNKKEVKIEMKKTKIALKNINKTLLISPVQKGIKSHKNLKRTSRKFKTLVKNPSSLKFFRLVLKNPNQKQKFSKKISETKIKLKRNRRQNSISDKSIKLFKSAKTVQKAEENFKNLLQQQLPKSIVTISSKEIVADNLKLNLIPNPLKFEDGDVFHAFYKKEYLIVIQQNTVSFWKYSKILQMLGQEQEWEFLGESRRNLNDEEILSPFKNRLLLHENTPIYIELRARQLPYSNRECNLLSPYICIYYFNVMTNAVVQHCVQLDSIKTVAANVSFTTITNTRYFIICWKQDTPNNTNRTGICKYALTPDLDTLASIREFKHLRHNICSLECISDERLVGFGETQITIWDYHSGDILSNLDLDMPIGRNLAGIMYSVEFENYILLYQLIHSEDENLESTEELLPQLKIFALNLSHNSPSYRLIYSHKLPLQFDNIKSALNLNNYLIVTSLTGEELWMFIQQPQRLLFMNDEISTSLKRFYTTGCENYVEITGDYLNVKTIHENLMNFIAT